MPSYVVAQRSPSGTDWSIMRTKPVVAADAATALRTCLGLAREDAHHRVIDFDTGEVSNFHATPPAIPPVDIVPE